MKLSEFYRLEAKACLASGVSLYLMLSELNYWWPTYQHTILQGEKNAYGNSLEYMRDLDKNHRVIAILLLAELAEDQGL